MEQEPLRPSGPSELAELKSQYNSLHSTLVAALLLMIVVSGTIWIFMMRQAKTAKLDLDMIGVNYINAMVQFERTKPVIDETVKKMQDFGRTNADFVPILSKYNLLPGATSAPAGGRPPGKK